MLRPLGNTFLFAFMDENVQSKGGAFKETTSSGIIMSVNQLDQARPRWAMVLAVGPLCEVVTENLFVLIKPFKWTNGFKHDGIDIWKSDESQVLMTSPTTPPSHF